MTHTRWKITVATIGIGLMAFGLSACGESEPIEVPDVVGMTGYDARDELQGQDFKTEMNALDGSAVFNTGNWEVESTDPGSGELVEPKSEITVNLVRPEEGESSEEPVDEEPEASSSEPDYEFTVSDYGDGTEVLVHWNIETGLTAGMTERTGEQNAFDAIQQAAEHEPNYDRISLNGYTETVDEYGNEDWGLAIVAAYDRETVEQINFENTQNVDLWDIRDAGGGCLACD